MKSSTSRRGSSRSVNNIIEGAAAVATSPDGTPRSGSVLSGTGPLTGTASLQNSKLSLNSQGSHQSENSQKPIQEPAVDEEPTFLEKAKFYTSLCLGKVFLGIVREQRWEHLPISTSRNHCNPLGICISLSHPLRCRSGHIDYRSGFWSSSCDMYRCGAYVRGGFEKLHLEFVSRGLHDSCIEVSGSKSVLGLNYS